MFTDLIPALIGASTAAATIIGFLAARSLRKAEAHKADAEGRLAAAKATDLLIENLAEQYREAHTELGALRAEMADLRARDRAREDEVSDLRSEVADLTARVSAFEAIVRTLPEEHQRPFAPVMRTPRKRRRAPDTLPGNPT